MFKCFRHWFTLVLRDAGGLGHFLHRKEVVTQGDPLSMISYVIAILPLLHELLDVHLQVTQTWDADNAGA